MGLCFLSESTRRLTNNCSGFKASQKTGPWLKVSSDILGEPGIKPRTPGYCTKQFTYPLVSNCIPNIVTEKVGGEMIYLCYVFWFVFLNEAFL